MDLELAYGNVFLERFSGGSGQQTTIQKFSYDGSYIVTVYGSGRV
ncbi:MAG: hypothetical protein ABR591_02495 [Candidatus Velthaea sp.]